MDEQEKAVRMYSELASRQSPEFQLKETSPFLGAGQIFGGRVVRADKPVSTYDLVEQVHYLFVRVVKARDLPPRDAATGSLDPYVEARLGSHRGATRHFERRLSAEWNEVFAFSKERAQSNALEVAVRDRGLKDGLVGLVRFDLGDVPTRVPPDGPLAPEWYRLETASGERAAKGEVMLAVWVGTQADECFPSAWHSDAVSSGGASFSGPHIRSKVYHAPRLWYVRVNVIEAQDVVAAGKGRLPDLFVKVQLGSQVLRTRTIHQARTPNPLWNEDLMFVAAEPFEDQILLSVEDRVGPNKDETVGRVHVPLGAVERRIDDRIVSSRWLNLEKHSAVDAAEELGKINIKKDKLSSRLHVRVCLDGGYHVFHESTHYSSDLRPAARQLWRPSIGLLEVGILNAAGLHPMKTRDGKGTCDTYCVAKYGHKWVRTRTIIDSLGPRYNEQYTWEVYDPATVVTVCVFDNCQIGDKGGGADAKIGKVRIRLSTLEAGRIYTHSYPLLVLSSSGLRKMGELHLAVRLSATSFSDMMLAYSRPLLPRMHYVRPLSAVQLDMLRYHAVQTVAARLSRTEPPLRKEVIEYVSDVDSHLWSMRRSKANFFRLVSVFSGLCAAGRWFGEVCAWRNPATTVLVHVLFLMLVCLPELVLPTAFLYMFVAGLWNYRRRPRHPPHMDTRVSHAEAAHPDELDEELDTFPTSRGAEVVRMRYDRMRSVAGRVQAAVGDVATQGERVQALLSWRDGRATAIFLVFCAAAALVLYVTPFQVVLAVAGFYVMRHPRFRQRMPWGPVNYFRRLPARTDSLL
ncbi:FT-interacting protein 1-like [Iris pallida]|uniref:FT-interacting protein 1-like n=1 Tax=Iris pallida TaxID=29817 RepID=A0AAX6EKX1_IRIPA|nr:FT-interacting protein 1-like [Iris pallida]